MQHSMFNYAFIYERALYKQKNVVFCENKNSQF